MKYCKRCLNPENHPLGITFDERGVCSGCLVHEEKYEIDWKQKEKDFEEILSQYRDRPGTFYDCIIPVSGIGDDFFVVDTVKNKFKMNPLLVTYNTHFSTKVGVRNLARLITELDCDHIMSTVGPETVKRVTKTTLSLIGDMYWHVLAGSRTFPVQVATKFNIPLIIWGVNGWLDQVGMFSHHDEVEMTKKVRKEHALRRLDAESLLGVNSEISHKDLQPYTYPSDVQLEKSRVRGLYLGNYVFWDSQKQIGDMIDKYGYETLPQEGTFNSYESINCFNNDTVNDYIKFLKYGYGKTTDHASRDIRLKRMTREEGIEYVRQYENKEPTVLKEFLDWVSITKEEFYGYIDPFRDEKAWVKNPESGEWELTDSVINHIYDDGIDEVRLDNIQPLEYRHTELLEEEDGKYILMGRVYMDKDNYKAIEG